MLHGRFIDGWLLPPEGDIEMAITSRGLHRDDYFLQRVTLMCLITPNGDIEMTITSRWWHWDDYYLQMVTLRWLIPPEGDIEVTITSRWWHWNDYYLQRVTLIWLLSTTRSLSTFTKFFYIIHNSNTPVPHVEQELLNLPENLNPPSVYSKVLVTSSSVFCVMFCRWLFVLFLFGHYIVCPSVI